MESVSAENLCVDTKWVVQPAPPGFEVFEYEHHYHLKYSVQQVADWLNRPETFCDGQIFPYRVEFLSKDPFNTKPGFQEGVYTNHHGPLLNANGVLTKIDHLNYRDLLYFYGSYVISFRLIRPTRLQFWLAAEGEGHCHLKMQLDSYVRPWFKSIYHAGLAFFFTSFEQTAKRGIKKMIGASS